MKEQLLDTWAIHQRMNLLLLDNTTDEGLQKTLSTRGGRTVFRQWVHIHQVRLQWLGIAAKELLGELKPVDQDGPVNKKMIRRALEDSAKAIAHLLEKGWDDGGKIKGFKKGVLPLLGYFISHESHHRGNIILTLKEAGEKIPDTVKWGLWEWGK